jgi:uncharacterized membrane protein YfcA
VNELIATFASTIADSRFPIAVGFAALAGLVRGFTGFGSALIYMPLVSAVYGPHVAAATLLLIDTVCGFPFAVHALPYCNRREVTPVMIAGALALPFGVWALLWLDPLILRWFIAVLALSALAVLVAGWRYHGRPTLVASLSVGAMAGFGAGAVQIGAPPLLVYWLGGQNSATTVRANIMVYFIMQGVLACALYFYGGLFTAQTVALALLLGLPFGGTMVAGAYWFHGSSDLLYRRLAYVIIALAGLISLPLFDGLR